MNAKTITFNPTGKTYKLEAIGAASPAIVLSNMSTPELLELYNCVASNIGKGRVNRFADRGKAIARTWAILEAYELWLKEEDGFEASEEELAQQKGRAKPEPVEEPEGIALKQKRTPDGASVLAKPKKAGKVELPKADKAQIAAEARDRKASGEGSKVERWRTPKRREPSKRCYMPRPGSKQDTAYKLLTQKGGIRVEDFCTQMSALDTSGKNTTEWKEPGTIWGGLNYLFVTQKGYGLNFDGERIELLIGAEEVPFSTTKKA